MKSILVALRLLLVLSVLTGILYPLVITAIAQVFFSRQANGSMVMVNGKITGSELIGQKFASARYFWSRPSAIDYNPMPSGASNLGPTSTALQELIQQRRAHFVSTQDDSGNINPPVDLVFASASGVDPHISPAAARMQIDRIAKARSFTIEQRARLADLVERFIEPRQWGIFGEPRVNVLLLNLALDQLQ